jgi:hypothetical protein
MSSNVMKEILVERVGFRGIQPNLPLIGSGLNLAILQSRNYLREASHPLKPKV